MIILEINTERKKINIIILKWCITILHIFNAPKNKIAENSILNGQFALWKAK